MAKWEELPIADRAQYMRVAVQNGYRDIRSIREAYNEYAEGGEKEENRTYYAGTLPMVPVIARRHIALPERNNSTWLRKRLYQNIEPRSYDDMASRITKAIAGVNTRTGEVTPEEDALWAYYMQQNPAEVSKYLEWSPLQPTKGSTKYNTVVRYKKGISDEVLKKAVEKIPLGKNAQSSALFPDILAGLGDYTIGHGEDEYGKYVSIYDDWDLSTGAHNTGDMTLGIGTPFTVYDRRYYTDDDIKKANGGNLFLDGGPEGNKTGPTYNPETKTWTNAKGQNITGMSFKGDYGTSTYYDTGAVDLNTKPNYHGFHDAKNHKWRYAENAPRVYIGGDKNAARQKYFDLDTELTSVIKTTAEKYGISPSLLASRMAKEGPIDEAIQHYNNTNGYFKRGHMIGPVWGLDDMGTWITNGIVQKPENIKNLDTDLEMDNEKGRTTWSVGSDNYMDGVELTALALKHFKDEMRKKYPKASDALLEQYAAAAFNNGVVGAVSLINKGKLKNAYKPFIKIKRKGGYLTI